MKWISGKMAVCVRILEHCRDGFRPITPLVGVAAPRTSLYRWKEYLLRKGLLEADGKDQYRTTPAGVQKLSALREGTLSGLAKFYPLLEQVPTLHHRAVIELALAAVVARKYALRDDRHPTFVLAGPTLSWKTSAGAFTCHILGLDPSKQIVNLAAESGLSLWLRKTPTGQVTYKRDLLDSDLIILDEFQAADSQTKRLVSILTDGRRTINFENEQLTVHPVPILTLNPSDATTFEDRLHLSTPQIRRSIICDLSKVKIPDLALKGEDILAAAKLHGAIELRTPKGDCTEHKVKAYTLLKSCLNPHGLELVDFEMLLMLSSALTGYLEPLDAIRAVFSNSFLLFDTLGWTLPGWVSHVSAFPSEAVGLQNDLSMRSKSISAEIWANAFQYLDSGGSVSGLISKQNITIDDAQYVVKRYAELRELEEKVHRAPDQDEEVMKLVHEVRVAELRKRKAEQEKPFAFEKTLHELEIILSHQGSWKKNHCSHFNDNYCRCWLWNEKPAAPYQISEPLQKDGKWYINPNLIQCAACPLYHERGTVSISDFDRRTIRTEGRLCRIENGLKRTPVFDMRNRYQCASCGAKKLVAVKIHCTNCGTEDWWGYHPE